MRQLRLATVLSLFCLAFTSNITIDDQNGDPTNGNKIIYDPPEAWAGNAIGGCDGCLLPNSSTVSASAGTFTGSLFTQTSGPPPTAAVNFTGVFVSVICIFSNSLDDPPGESDMTFSIDGILADTFHYTPTGAGGFESRGLFDQSLPPGEHTLVISNGQNSLVILDSIIYSTGLDLQSLAPTSASSPSASEAPVQVVVTKIPTNTLIAITVCGVFLAVLFLLLAFLYIRHRRKQHLLLSTTLISPLPRSLWSESEYNLKPPPDIIVPFPTSIHPVPRPPAPTPQPRRLDPPVPPPGLLSPFNANLPDGRVRRRPPPPIPTQNPPSLRAAPAFASSRAVEISDTKDSESESRPNPGVSDIAGQQEVSQVDYSDQSSISTPPPSYSS